MSNMWSKCPLLSKAKGLCLEAAEWPEVSVRYSESYRWSKAAKAGILMWDHKDIRSPEICGVSSTFDGF